MHTAQMIGLMVKGLEFLTLILNLIDLNAACSLLPVQKSSFEDWQGAGGLC